MKISGTSNNSFQNKVLIDTFIEQISALQTDVGNLQIADDNLAQALATKANTADINTAVNTGTLGAQTGNIKTLKVQGTGSSATIENATIGTASIGTETVTQSNITNLEVADVDAGTVRTGTLTVENDATISGNVAVQDVSAKDITSASVNTLNVTTAEADINKLEAQNAEVTGKLEVNDLEVNGTFSGVSNIESESVNTKDITADTAEIETLDVENIRSWVTQVMNQDQILNPPSPALGNVDTYTIELPRFDGVFLLSWEDADVVWSATVIGNGKSYGISWGARTEQNYITDLFQYNGKLYIRINSNGKLKYAYSTTKEPDQIVIYRNMNGWTPDKSLEELCDELSHIQNVYSAGTAWLGPVYIPRLLESDKSTGAFNFKGSCTFADIPDFVDVLPGDVWNITDESYTDSRFVEGAGKPINAGDDVVAVEVETSDASELEAFEPELFGDKWIYNIGQTKTLDGDYLVIADESDSGATSITLYKGKNGTWTSLLEDCGASIVTHTGRIIVEKTFYNPSLAYSDDNGETWTDLPYEYRAEYGWGSFIELGNSIWYQTAYGSHYRSDDNGLTWVSKASYGNCLAQIRENVLINSLYDGVRSSIYKSVDNGDTWSTISTVNGSLNSLAVLNGYVFAEVNNKILRSSDEGVTWEEIYTPQDNELYNKLYVIDNKLFVLCDDDIYLTKDNGDTFEKFIEIDSSEQIIKSSDEYIIRQNSGWGPSNIYYCIYGTRKVLKWDKFAAGVNYDNFVAKKITATESLKSDGTFEVDGVSTFNNNITQTGNYTATGNLNRTGNETIIGTVVIGDLD